MGDVLGGIAGGMASGGTGYSARAALDPNVEFEGDDFAAACVIGGITGGVGGLVTSGIAPTSGGVRLGQEPFEKAFSMGLTSGITAPMSVAGSAGYTRAEQ